MQNPQRGEDQCDQKRGQTFAQRSHLANFVGDNRGLDRRGHGNIRRNQNFGPRSRRYTS